MVVSGALGGTNNSLVRFSIGGLNVNNSFVSATLRLYVGAGTTGTSNALVEAALSTDASGAAWDVGNGGLQYSAGR